MTPLAYYQAQINNGTLTADTEQLKIMHELDKIHHSLMREHKRRTGVAAFLHKRQLVQGMYLCGGVGIGKTMMMDCFYQAIPFEQKLRMHFHPFMRMIHSELTKNQGKKNPVNLIAKELAQKYMLICFDEFFVTDITDAMLLARLLNALFKHGVTLVATSNTMPDDLYKRGLQRDQFLPAIDLLKKHTLVVHIPATEDYRERHLDHAGVFFIPNDEDAKIEMEKSFQILTHGSPVSVNPVLICGRKINIIKSAQDIIWFDFKIICSPPRSQQDYLEISEKYNTVFISDIFAMSPDAHDRISLFIRLIDVFYDAHIRLVISAESIIENLYPHGRMVFEYTRACSRLREMQSAHYFYKKQ